VNVPVELPSSAQPPVTLHESFDVERVAQEYRDFGRVHIPHALADECAQRVHACLESEVPWQLHFNDGDRSYDLVQEQVQSLPDANRVLLLDLINAKAGNRFQYLFNNFPLTDAYAAGRLRELYVMRVLEYLNSQAFLSVARAITDCPRISLVDAQATLYRSGHFLTCHDDNVHGKGRIAAYVLNFTPEWRSDWGGLLTFLSASDHVIEGYTPRFNALNIFRVPQRHAVTYVAPFTNAGRYSISGWLRTP